MWDSQRGQSRVDVRNWGVVKSLENNNGFKFCFVLIYLSNRKRLEKKTQVVSIFEMHWLAASSFFFGIFSDNYLLWSLPIGPSIPCNSQPYQVVQLPSLCVSKSGNKIWERLSRFDPTCRPTTFLYCCNVFFLPFSPRLPAFGNRPGLFTHQYPQLHKKSSDQDFSGYLDKALLRNRPFEF